MKTIKTLKTGRPEGCSVITMLNCIVKRRDEVFIQVLNVSMDGHDLTFSGKLFQLGTNNWKCCHFWF